MPSKTKSRATQAPPVPKPEHPALAALKRSRWLYVVVSVIVLAPCYWQSRLQAGDLSSHVYNAWLAQLIESGHIQGLHIASQTTNVLFDLILGGLLKAFGPGPAQRISVGLSVLIFIWGAFLFARVVSGRMPWPILPCITMLAYGWVFHMGFFNFYLSMGLCFFALALLWEPSIRRVAAAVPILIVACVAHALPVAWMAGLAAYAAVARRLSPKSRILLTAASIAVILIVRLVIAATIPSVWTRQQMIYMTGLDQVWIFDTKYYVVMVALLFLWAFWFLRLLHMRSGRQLFADAMFQICLISAAAIVILPTSMLIPGYQHALGFIADRMSLVVGICFCALLACVTPTRFERYAMTVVAIVFFAFLYRDERAINSLEDRMQHMVAGLPPGQRVISAIDDPTLRINLVHLIDRACVGHCFSYANYEPSTAQFRVRADGVNPYVASTYADSWLLQTGAYVVKERDLPLYQVDLDPAGQMVMKSLRAGAASGSTSWSVLGDLL